MGLFSFFKKNKEKRQEAKKYLVGMEKTRKSSFGKLLHAINSPNLPFLISNWLPHSGHSSSVIIGYILSILSAA